MRIIGRVFRCVLTRFFYQLNCATVSIQRWWETRIVEMLAERAD